MRVVLLRAAGKAFCAGGDIGMFTGDPATVRATLSDLFTPLNDFIARIARMYKVWLAQAHGAPPAPACRWYWPATSPSPMPAPAS